MVKLVKKRDGSVVDFKRAKVLQAISNALKATQVDAAKAANITEKVISIIDVVYKKMTPSVENIQDLVEQTLINEGFLTTAKAYILYREQHAQLRNTQDVLENALELVDNYIGEMDWKVKENSNMGYSLQGLNNYISANVSSYYWLNKIYDTQVQEAHESGSLHIHDLGLLSVYCCGWDLMDLLTQGLGGVSGKVESGPPKHLRSALGQIINFFYTLQGEAAGAQAFSNFDTLLAPFIKYDGLTYEEVKQAMQEFVFNINIPTRVGFQTPFTNITMDLQAPKMFENTPVMVGGVPQKETYGEFQTEMNMLNRAFCEVMIQGDFKGRIFTFPIPTYNITKDFDWNNKELDPLWKMTAKYGVPYFSNFVNSDMDPEDARSMCCRLRLDNRELRKRGGGLFASNPMTGSIGVVTINLPRLAYEAKGNKEAYFKRLDYLLTVAKSSLEIKRKVLERFTDSGLYPYAKHYLEEIKERFGTYWANHFNTIGILGMNEAALNMYKVDIVSEKGKDFAVETLTFIRNKLAVFQEESGMLYNLEATPGEGTTYRFARVDKAKYPDIITAGGKEPYYTNSSHLPVDFTNDIFEALQHQDKLQTLYTGGTVLHGFLGEKIEDINICKKLVKKITDNFHLPYFTLSPTFSICPDHGYIKGEHHTCPVCINEKSEVVVADQVVFKENKEKVLA
ncbi:ribonucleoside triphosphate reductase [bacterium]|jgi:ribonucleoside-triphosphate reductase (formate)|nr:ribonucleoside triphosphate reductase [bacterium]MBT5988558.1 ribonucleoside triphosphate reductase [bacterium]